MRSYTITVNGQRYSVEIDDPNASTVQVKVNGNPFEVTVDEKGTPQVKAPATPRTQVDLELDAYVPAVASTFVDADLEPGDDSEATASSAGAPAPEGAETYCG